MGTVMLYLSQQSAVGGSTRFVGSDGKSGVCCAPAVGRALVFQHNILHEGEEVREGVKYTIRSDVEYGGGSLSGRLQEMVGLGGSPLQQSRRLRAGLSFCAVLLALAATWRCPP